MPKRVLFCQQYNADFGHLSCVDYARFWNKRRKSVSACVHRWKFFEFLRRGFYRSHKQLKIGIFEGCLGYSSNGTISGNGNRFGPSRHPKDVPFVSEFWCRMYGLGAISPRNQQISAKFHMSNLQNYKFQRCFRAYIAGTPPDRPTLQPL